jgi:hypothetical protein
MSGFCLPIRQEKPTRLQIEAAKPDSMNKLRNQLMQANEWTSVFKM